MNIFSSLKIYAGKWSIKTNMTDENGKPLPNPRNLFPEELSSITSAVIVASKYGKSVQFTRFDGGTSFIPLDSASSKSIGESLDITKIKILTLCKQGEKDIVRVID